MNLCNRVKRLSAIMLVAALACGYAQAVVYVDAAATGANDGTSWADAFTNLGTAMDSSASTAQLWVAKGTYVPGSSRTDSFRLKQGMRLYGGFANGMTSLSERDWNANHTILSGEIQGDAYHTNNTYNIVIANTNAVLDGFVLTGGYANGSGAANNGSAVYASYVGLDATPNMPQTIANCTFTNNFARDSGGAIWSSYSSLVITNSVFDENSAVINGGAIFLQQLTNRRNVLVYGSILRRNLSKNGGAVYATALQTLRFDKCTFIGNSATNGAGGAISASGNWPANPGAVNCLFVGNTATGSGGACGDRMFSSGSVYVMNTAGGNGGAINEVNTPGTVQNGIFVGNKTGVNGSGGALYVNGRSYSVKQTLFAGNAAGANGNGGGAHLQIGWGAMWPALVENCTLANNRAKNGGGLSVTTYQVAWNGVITAAIGTNRNLVVWGNVATGLGPAFYGNTNAVLYSDVQDGWTGMGANNISADPRFAKGPAGAWTAVGAYDPLTGQTVLTDASANWKPGVFAGACVNPDESQHLQTLIVTNTATTMTVYGDVGAFTAVGDAYQIWDYHLMSSGGRWTPAGWVYDNISSPAIDAGDPASVYALEPMNNGKRINMGVYGNTDQASKKPIVAMIMIIK